MKKYFKIILNKDKNGAYFKDFILMRLTPNIVEEIYLHFEKKALEENLCYDAQGKYREIRDYFKQAYDEWTAKRGLNNA